MDYDDDTLMEERSFRVSDEEEVFDPLEEHEDGEPSSLDFAEDDDDDDNPDNQYS